MRIFTEPLFHKECYKLVDYEKKAKLSWLQNPTHMNVGDEILT
jgi:hypothetical protein